jgi:hypothetical protein
MCLLYAGLHFLQALGGVAAGSQRIAVAAAREFFSLCF